MVERVAIVGTRDPSVALKIASQAYVGRLPATTVVVTGCAAGIDSIVRAAARLNGLVVVECHAPWEMHGKAAGPIRNSVIVALADRVVAFWDGESKGTADTIEKARKAGKMVEVIRG